MSYGDVTLKSHRPLLNCSPRSKITASGTGVAKCMQTWAAKLHSNAAQDSWNVSGAASSVSLVSKFTSRLTSAKSWQKRKAAVPSKPSKFTVAAGMWFRKSCSDMFEQKMRHTQIMITYTERRLVDSTFWHPGSELVMLFFFSGLPGEQLGLALCVSPVWWGVASKNDFGPAASRWTVHLRNFSRQIISAKQDVGWHHTASCSPFWISWLSK